MTTLNDKSMLLAVCEPHRQAVLINTDTLPGKNDIKMMFKVFCRCF